MSKPVMMILGLALVVAARGESAADQQNLRVEGVAQAIRFEDVDGDGDRDALVSVVREAGSDLFRAVAVFRCDRKRFASQPDAILPIATDVLFVDAADLDGDGAVEVLTLDTEGLSASAFRETGFVAPRRIVGVPSFFRATVSASLPFVDVAKDIDFDGREDLLIPARDGYVFFRSTVKREFEGPHRLISESAHGVSRGQNEFFRMTSRLARPTPTDWDGDGVGDLVLAFEKELVRVVLGRSGAPLAPEVVLDFTGLTESTASSGGMVTNEGKLLDIDGDRRCDLLFSQRVARPSLMAGAVTRTVLLLAADLTKNTRPKPRQVIRTDGVTSPPRLFDLDRDGSLDLIITTVRTDALSKLKESMLNAVQVTFFVHRFEPERGRFTDEPVFSDSLTMPADRLLDVGAYGWVTFQPDFDGDGRPDFSTYDARRKMLVVRKGYAEDSWFSKSPIAYEQEPFLEAAVELTGSYFGQDIDGDGRAEILSCSGPRVVIVTPVGR